jgi:predicted RND superfamily exporter protein
LTIRKRTIGLIVFGVLLIVSIFAAVAALQWWVATISTLTVPVVIAVGIVAAIVGYQNFNTEIRDLKTQLRLANEEIGKLEETIRRLQAPSRKPLFANSLGLTGSPRLRARAASGAPPRRGPARS